MKHMVQTFQNYINIQLRCYLVGGNDYMSISSFYLFGSRLFLEIDIISFKDREILSPLEVGEKLSCQLNC